MLASSDSAPAEDAGRLGGWAAEVMMLASSTTRVGADRAVAAGLDALGPLAIGTALDRLQLANLSGATRTAMKADPGLLPGLRQRLVTSSAARS